MVYVELDEKGRLILPKAVRDEVEASTFDLVVEADRRVILVPILPIEKLRGAFKTGAKRIEKFHDFEKTHFS